MKKKGYKTITISNYSSIVAPKDKCYNCGAIYDLTVDHLLGGATRLLCDQDKLVVPLCPICHYYKTISAKWTLEYRQLGQKVYEEKIGTRKDFIKRYGKSFL